MIKRIILASASPRRSEMLEKFNIKFEIIPSDASEDISESMPHDEYVCELAKRKGEAVRDMLISRGEDLSDTLIISCDTIVSYDGRVIGKPKNEMHAAITLSLLSDSRHEVYSGLSLICGDEQYIDFAKTSVKFAEIGEETISEYVKSGEPMGKAGSYAIQGVAASFVERIEGDYSNIVGFPLALFCKMLRRYFGMSIFELGKIR